MEESNSNSGSAPEWFQNAITAEGDHGFVEVQGARIEWRAWGSLGNPGLLLLPGNRSHARWWGFIAPLLASNFRVATLSWSGMGRSDWRVQYALELFAEEALAVAAAAGLYASKANLTIAGHSFGGIPTMLAAASSAGDRLGRAILVDCRLQLMEKWGFAEGGQMDHTAYPTREHAKARFGLAPPQTTQNRFIVDWLADEAVVDRDDGGGWSWRFDPNLQRKTKLCDTAGLIARARCPLAFIRGTRSAIVTDEIWAEQRALAPAGTVFLEIPDAAHHIMVDQPWALVEAIRSIAAGEVVSAASQ